MEICGDVNKFFLENNNDEDLILHIVPLDDKLHPIQTTPSVVFIKNISTDKVYCFVFDHPDSTLKIKKEQFVEAVNKLKNKIWVLDKKSTEQLLPLSNLLDVNLCEYLKNNKIVDGYEFNTSAYNIIHRNYPTISNINKIVPLFKHLETFEDLCKVIQKIIKGFKIDSGYTGMNSVILPTLSELERTGIFVDREMFSKRFSIDVDETSMVYSCYNIYTSTGRPSNRFGGVNYAALNIKDGSRECFISRYGKDGKILIIDYTAFHPRIICKLTQYPIPSDVNIYKYLAKLYFQKSSLDEIDITEAKNITFRQLYGGVDDKYSHIKYLSNLKDYVNGQWKFFNNNGYVLTPIFKRKITDKHILDPNPTKNFNYILQATEGEIAIPKIQEIQNYLKNKKTKAFLYTYDAVLFDFHREDGLEILNELRRIMSWGGIFSMKTYIGSSYHSVKQISI